MERVLVKVKTTDVGLGNHVGVTTVVDDGTCNKRERAVGVRDRDDAENEGLFQSYSVGSVPEKCFKCMQRRGPQDRCMRVQKKIRITP